MLDPPTNNRPFADKRDKVDMDGVPKKTGENLFKNKNQSRILGLEMSTRQSIQWTPEYTF